VRLYVTGTIIDHVTRRSIWHAVPVPPAPPAKRKLFIPISRQLDINRHARRVSLASRLRSRVGIFWCSSINYNYLLLHILFVLFMFLLMYVRGAYRVDLRFIATRIVGIETLVKMYADFCLIDWKSQSRSGLLWNRNENAWLSQIKINLTTLHNIYIHDLRKSPREYIKFMFTAKSHGDPIVIRANTETCRFLVRCNEKNFL